VEISGVFHFADPDLVAFSGMLKPFFGRIGRWQRIYARWQRTLRSGALATAVAISEDPNLSLLQSSSAPIGFGQRVTAGAALDLAK
jgi:hypothetical protein